VLLFDRNQITSVPTDMCGWTKLVWFTGVQNKIASMPASINSLTQIGLFDFTNHPTMAGNVGTFDFRGWYQAYQISMPNGALSGVLQSTAFTGLANLNVLDLSKNPISGVLGVNAFDSLPSLTTLDLSSNQLTGFLPYFDGTGSALTGTDSVTINLAKNSLTGGVPTSGERERR
jgi:Leucine-rich repeat (LRR) protein